MTVATSFIPGRAVAQDSRGHEENGLQEGQHRIHGDSQEAKRNEEEPNEGIGDEGQEGDRPAEDQQDEPCHEAKHCIHVSIPKFQG